MIEKHTYTSLADIGSPVSVKFFRLRTAIATPGNPTDIACNLKVVVNLREICEYQGVFVTLAWRLFRCVYVKY